MAVYRNQAGAIEHKIDRQFYKDVVAGLTSSPKYLHSKYFYDKTGDRLFQQIMSAPEYYPTRCELEIFTAQTERISTNISANSGGADIVELGAGDAFKSKHLLHYLAAKGIHYTYYPIDISGNVISQLYTNLPREIEGLEMTGLQGDYLEMLAEAYRLSRRSKFILFLGSNIGNYPPNEAKAFLYRLSRLMQPGDRILIGLDLKKHPRIILDAYNDNQGYTREFNLNLLRRMNRELDANFNVSQFEHYPVYDPVTGACKSYLISLKTQEVTIAKRDVIQFEENEPVFMEISQKYSPVEIDTLAATNGFRVIDRLYDPKRWFTDVIWERI